MARSLTDLRLDHRLVREHLAALPEQRHAAIERLKAQYDRAAEALERRLAALAQEIEQAEGET